MRLGLWFYRLTAFESKSYTQTSKVFAFDIATTDAASPNLHSCFINLSIPLKTGVKQRKYHTNSLPVVFDIISKIRKQTDIPILDSTLDTSRDILPYDYLLSPPTLTPYLRMIPLSRLKSSSSTGNDYKLSERDNLLIDLQLGEFLGQLHSGVQNDWFGLPTSVEESDAPPPLPTFNFATLGDAVRNAEGESEGPSYSWQETFTSSLEELLQEVQDNANNDFDDIKDLPYEEIRIHLSRAIGSFLFDDVEIPSLIWFTGSEDDIFVSFESPSSPEASVPSKLPTTSVSPKSRHRQRQSLSLSSGGLPLSNSFASFDGHNTSTAPNTVGTSVTSQTAPESLPSLRIAAILPNVGQAIWGDPLLETFFLPHPQSADTNSPARPSRALLEGYKGGGGRPLTIFPRQKTKRIWYTMLLCLVLIVEKSEKRAWAVQSLKENVAELKGAPTY